MSLPVTPAVVPAAAPARTGARRRPVLAVEHVGPQWFPAAMGTGILATCTERLAATAPALHGPALAALGLAWLVLLTVGGAFGLHALRRPDRFRATVSDLAVAPFYGTAAMGLLSVGSATGAVLGPHLPATAAALAWLLWVLGTLLGVGTALGCPVRLLTAAPEERGAPTPVWALAVVPPMVSAASGVVLTATLPPGPAATALLVACGALFVLALVPGAVVFALAYGRLARGHALPLQSTPALWIPLGMAGQSAAAVNLALVPAAAVLPAAALADLRTVAVGYSTVALLLGAAAAVVATAGTVRALRRGLAFSPAWWSFTFPAGTMGLGASALGTTLGTPWLLAVSAVVCAGLAGTVGLCLVRSARCWAAGPAAGGQAARPATTAS